MSQPTADNSGALPPNEPNDPNQQIMQATIKYYERITPWLFDVGSWIYGGLIAFNLFILGPLLTIRPYVSTIVVSITAFALVLPLAVAGLVLLRLARDVDPVKSEVEFDNAVRQALLNADPTSNEPLAAAAPLEVVRRRRTDAALIISSSILTLCVIATLVGMSAALWQVAWWIAIGFAAMALLSSALVSAAFAYSRPRQSSAEKANRRRYEAEVARQARAQAERQETAREQAREQARQQAEQEQAERRQAAWERKARE